MSPVAWCEHVADVRTTSAEASEVACADELAGASDDNRQYLIAFGAIGARRGVGGGRATTGGSDHVEDAAFQRRMFPYTWMVHQSLDGREISRRKLAQHQPCRDE